MIRAGVFVPVLIDIYKTKPKGHKFPGSLFKTITDYGICSIQEPKDNQSIPEIQLALYRPSGFFFKDLIQSMYLK